MKKYTRELIEAMAQLQNPDEIERFMRDVLTPTEMEEVATRYQIAKLLWTTELSYADIAGKLNTSTTTVTRVARFLNKENYQGYKTVLERLYPQKE